ncbi:hypothetical protein ABFX02_03G027900 [Erythranthe guttata]
MHVMFLTLIKLCFLKTMELLSLFHAKGQWMSNNQVQRGWEERVICPEKGSREVHYILRDSTANSLLVVVGIERSYNHTFYTVTEDYLRVFGSTAAVNARTAWKVRKYVVEFLISITSGGGSLFANSNTLCSYRIINAIII